MKNTHTVEGFIDTVDRVGGSSSGNPTYRVVMKDGGAFLTEVDGQVGYKITNYRPHSMREPRKVRLTLKDRSSRIVDCEWADE